MPIWTVLQREYDLPRNIAFLDTNVLVSLMDDRDQWHENTHAVLELNEFRWAVTHANLIEAWNLLVGRGKRIDLAHDLMNWALTPGQVILVGDAIEPVATASLYSRIHRVDLVDAGLLDLTSRVSADCGLVPYAHVATYDAADFLRLFGTAGLTFHVYDMRDASSTSFVE